MFVIFSSAVDSRMFQERFKGLSRIGSLAPNCSSLPLFYVSRFFSPCILLMNHANILLWVSFTWSHILDTLTFWRAKIWFKVKRVLFKTSWWFICNENAIYNNLNYAPHDPTIWPNVCWKAMNINHICMNLRQMSSKNVASFWGGG